MKFMDVALAAMFAVAVTTSLVAQDGADLYKKRCSGCHGAGGEGKPTVKAPALKGTKLEGASSELNALRRPPIVLDATLDAVLRTLEQAEKS